MELKNPILKIDDDKSDGGKVMHENDNYNAEEVTKMKK